MQVRGESGEAAVAKTTVRFPAGLHRQLRVRAVSEGTTFERLVIELIQKGLEAEKAKPKRRPRS